MSKSLNTRLAPSRAILPFAFLLLTLVATTLAQSSTATLSGTVQDENSAVIPGSKITLTNPSTGLERTVTTNESGSFTIPLLPPGEYTVLVEREGFTRVQLTNVVLNVGDQKAVQVQLKVGDVSTTVEVRPDATLVRTDGSVGTVIDQQFVRNLPMNGRSFQTLLELTPGIVIAPSGTTNPGQFSVNGQRTNANYFTVDGVSANAGLNSGTGGRVAGPSAAGQVPSLTASGTTAALVSADSLQEFRIQTSSYSAEFGRQPGGQVQLVTKSGANDFHGTVYDYVRNEAFDANNWFNNRNRLKRPPLRQQLFGGTFSGPLPFLNFGDGSGKLFHSGKDRTFFFLSYEGLRLVLPVAGESGAPTACFRGEISQCGPGESPAPSQFWPILQAQPRPNGPAITNAQGQPTGFARYAFSYGNPSSYDATAIKVDHTFGPFTFFGRYARTPSEAKTRTSGSSSFSVASQENMSITVGSSWMISKSSFNDIRVNYTSNSSPNYFDHDNFAGAIPLQTFGFQGADPSRSLLVITGVGLAGTVSTAWGTNFAPKQRQTNIVDNLSLSVGDHQLKFGMDFRRSNPILDSRAGVSQEALILTSASFIPGNSQFGRAFSYSIDYFVRDGSSAAAFDNLSLFAQDTWKFNKRLTLTYGLRWELVPPPHATEGPEIPVLSGLDDPLGPAGVAIAPAGTPFWKTRYFNFAPRIGASYLLFDSPSRQLVVRGGFGLFYDLGAGNSADGYARGWPFQASIRYPIVGHADPACRITTPASGIGFPFPSCALTPGTSILGPGSHFVMDPELLLPITYQWNISAEQSLGARQTITVSYVGAEGRRLIKNDSYSVRFQGVPYSTPTATTNLNIQRNGGYSDYRSLQLQFQRRLTKGFQAIANYTLGFSHDTDSSEAGIAVPSSAIPPSFHHGYSSYDVRHNMTVATTYEIPGFKGNGFLNAVTDGWGLDVMFRKRSAFPLNVTYNNTTLPSLPGSYALQANLIPEVAVWIEDSNEPGGRRLNNRAYTAADNATLLAAGCLRVARGPNDGPAVPIGVAAGAFCTPASGPVGNLPRNSIRGFGAKQVDVSLRREFRLREKVALQVRLDAFNIFNWPNFADPSGELSNSSAFGITFRTLNAGLGGLNGLYQIGGPRSLQGMARISF